MRSSSSTGCSAASPAPAAAPPPGSSPPRSAPSWIARGRRVARRLKPPGRPADPPITSLQPFHVVREQSGHRDPRDRLRAPKAPAPRRRAARDPGRDRGAAGRARLRGLLDAPPGRALRLHGAHHLSLLRRQEGPLRHAARGAPPAHARQRAARAAQPRPGRDAARGRAGLRALRAAQSLAGPAAHGAAPRPHGSAAVVRGGAGADRGAAAGARAAGTPAGARHRGSLPVPVDRPARRDVDAHHASGLRVVEEPGAHLGHSDAARADPPGRVRTTAAPAERSREVAGCADRLSGALARRLRRGARPRRSPWGRP